MDDAKTRRYHAESVERLHAPFHELVTLVVALKFQLHVEVKRLFRTVVVDHDRMVHHQVHRHQWFDAFGILAQSGSHAAHGSQVRQKRHARKVLQNHA